MPPTLAPQEDNNNHISSLLAHLPESADANPGDYDWQAAELNLAAGEDIDAGKPPSILDRKAGKLIKARKRADKLDNAAEDRPLTRLMPREIHDASRKETQPRLEPMSEGNAPAESSSQGIGIPPMTSTQPVRGIHADRAAGGAKKKKKRIAGF